MVAREAPPDSQTLAGDGDPIGWYQRILVAIDGSPQGELALRHAVGIARCHGARLELVCVPPPAATPWWGAPPLPQQDMRREYDELLRQAAIRVPEDVPVTRVLLEGPAASAIVKHADERCCDLIVMGSRGHARVRSAICGNVPQDVVHRSGVPVLIVHVPVPVEDRAAEEEPARAGVAATAPSPRRAAPA
jgi:nucleotide-binding universal stress UspA family protein